MKTRPIYMDNQSTTKTDPRVVEAMLPFLTEEYGNAASVTHLYGLNAQAAVESARQNVADLLGCEPKTIVFTSGATESNNITLKGVLRGAEPGSHLIINAAEHKAVIDPARKLEREGFEVTILPVDKWGMVDPTSVKDHLKPTTALVSVMLANNEVGTINPIENIGSICRDAGVLFHTDATQSVGKLPIDLSSAAIDLLSLSAHKMHGPKGIGALYVCRKGRRILIEPLVDGGGHERRLRSGTLPVHQIVGLGEACRICRTEMGDDCGMVQSLRNRLRDGLKEKISNVGFNGHPESRLPGSLHVSFEGVNSEALMTKLKDVLAVSSGSACTTADPEPSHVLLAMGIDEDTIDSSIRFGLGRFNTHEEVDLVIEAVAETVERLRKLSPFG
jgi:cysteine desulfurase